MVHNEWDEYAASWDQDAAARAYAAAAFSSLEAVMKSAGIVLASADALDFGCGTGLLTELLVAAGASVRAVDTSPAMIAVLDDKISKHGWTTVTTELEIGPDQATIDLIVCSSVCAFLDDYPGTVAELASTLRPGGLFVQWDWERTTGEDHGLGRTEMTDALQLAGLVDVEVATGFAVSVDDQTMSPLMGHGRQPIA